MKLRFNGTAPAWPHLLGTEHPFYQIDKPDSLGSASYSILGSDNKSGKEWEILIDAGHNTVPVLLQNGNRIPNAIVLTHGHPDHVLGIDWVIQSLRFNTPGAKMPLYCSQLVFEEVIKNYAHCLDYIAYHELKPGEINTIPEIPGIELTAYSVYHGKGAKGAMAVFVNSKELANKSVLITGDLLCPLFRKKDVAVLKHASKIIVDTNNQYPYPASNHISLISGTPESDFASPLLQEWLHTSKVSDYIIPHSSSIVDEVERKYFQEILEDYPVTNQLPHTIIDLLKLLPIPTVYLVHYFGKYDELHYNSELLSREELVQWASDRAMKAGITSNFFVPEAGQHINI